LGWIFFNQYIGITWFWYVFRIEHYFGLYWYLFRFLLQL